MTFHASQSPRLGRPQSKAPKFAWFEERAEIGHDNGIKLLELGSVLAGLALTVTFGAAGLGSKTTDDGRRYSKISMRKVRCTRLPCLGRFVSRRAQ